MSIISPCVYDETLQLVKPTQREIMQAWIGRAEDALDYAGSSSKLTLERGCTHVYRITLSGSTRAEATAKADEHLARFLDRVAWESGYREIDISRKHARMPGGRLQVIVQIVYAIEEPEHLRRPTHKPESPDAGPQRTSMRRSRGQYRIHGGQYRIRGAELDQPIWIE